MPLTNCGSVIRAGDDPMPFAGAGSRLLDSAKRQPLEESSVMSPCIVIFAGATQFYDTHKGPSFGRRPEDHHHEEDREDEGLDRLRSLHLLLADRPGREVMKGFLRLLSVVRIGRFMGLYIYIYI